MNLIVDTSVWSLVLRRSQVDEKNPYVVAFRAHMESGNGVYLLGNILQELLDGVRAQRDFDHLVGLLKPFPLIQTLRETYISASKLRNHCRKKGLQASPADFLIAAACIENGYPLLTSDHDFVYISKHCELKVLNV